jgi:asparagine synthetase B (glutamine-hydrolysing)
MANAMAAIAGHWRLDGTCTLGPEAIALRDGKGALVADARLDNRPELEALIRLDPTRAREMSDAAMLAVAVERWGESAVDRVLGDFAFAWWDAEGGRLVLARDFAGMRPLHFSRADGVAFGSAQAGERVPAGHIVTVTADGTVLRRWWRPQPRELGLVGDADHAEALHAQVEAAVRSRLRDSGGAVAVDGNGFASAALASVVTRLTFRPPTTQGATVLLTSLLGDRTIGYAGTEHLPPFFAGAMLKAAPLVPGLLKRAREQRLASFDAIDLADSVAEIEARTGMEVRDPTADRRLVEFCLSVPEKQWIAGGVPGSLGKRAFEGLA